MTLPENQIIGYQIYMALQRYVEHRIPTGDFLRAVLENNLKDAIFKADDKNRLFLTDIVRYVYNELPGECWGSPEKVSKWLKG